MATQLLEPILTNGIRQTNFFNGRLLTATDLRDQQNANRRQHDQLGRTVGAGIVTGLEVTLGTASAGVPTVQVTKGLAFNRQGQALEVQQDLILDLARQRDPAATEAGLFANCVPPSSGTVALGRGIYLLALAPASGYQERVPLVRFNEADRATGCGDRYAVEGVQFRLVQLDLADTELFSPAIAAVLIDYINDNSAVVASRSRLQNLLAHLCFGLPTRQLPLAASLATVAATSSSPILFEALFSQAVLDGCDVPLALLYWTPAGLQFVDMWAVRRHIARCTVPNANEQGAIGPCRATREALLFQFLAQINALHQSLTASARASMMLADYFDLLPPVGLVPGIGSGFDPATLFGSRLHGRYVVVASDVLQAMVEASFSFDALATAEESPIYLFAAEEPAGSRGDIGATYLLFAGHQLLTHFQIPLTLQRGLSRFDSTTLRSLLQETLDGYRGLERIILTIFADRTTTLTNLDQLGLLALQQLIGLAQNVLARTRAESLTQDEALAAFVELAHAQQHFTTTYADLVLGSGTPAIPGVRTSIRYTDSFRQMISAIAELLTRTTTSAGITGLFQALATFDLFAAATTQRAINQYLSLQTGGIPRGNLNIRFAERPTSAIQPGDIVNFVFTIEARTNLSESYRVRAVVETEQAQAAWLNALRLLADDFQPLANETVTIAPNRSVTVIVQIRGVPPNTDDTQVQIGLVATSQRNPTELTGASSLESFTVGGEIVEPAPDIDIVRTAVQGSATIVDGVILINPESDGATVILQTTFAQRGLYHVQLSIRESEAATWTVALINPTPLPSGTPGYDLREASLPSTHFIRVGLLPDRTAATTTLSVRVVDADDESRFRTFIQPIGVG